MNQDMKKKSRLGRGLSSLMGMNAAGGGEAEFAGELPVHASVEGAGTGDPSSAPRGTVPSGTPLAIDPNLIDPNPHQPRRRFSDAALLELSASIKENGVIQPLVVKPVGERYQLIAGERRLRASKLAGLQTVPVFVRDADELAQAQMALVENIQREDLNPIDRAAGYRILVSELGVSQTELATRLGEERATITNHLRLLDLPPAVQDWVRDGSLALGHAKVLCGIQLAEEQRRLAEACIKEHLSVRALEKLIAEPPPTVTTNTPAKTLPSAHLKELELNLTKQLGLKVQVRTGATKSKGKMVIHYGSLDEFDQLVERLGVRLEE